MIRSRRGVVIAWAFLVFMLFFIGLPVLVMFGVSWMAKPDILSVPPNFSPSRLTLENYSSVLENGYVISGVRNGLVVSAATTVVSLITGLPAAWALAKFHSRSANRILLLIMATQMIPLIVLVIPFYKLFSSIGLIDNPLALIAIYCGFCLPFTMWMAKGFFDQVPTEIVEAAAVDGVTRTGTFLRIGLPLIRTGIVAIAVFCFLLSWNEYLIASTLIHDDEFRTMPTQLVASFIGQFAYQWGPMMAAGVLVSVPLVLMFLLVQRQIVSGLMGGAVKR